MHTPQAPLKIWMPRTHLEAGKSALAVDLSQAGLIILEHDLQRLHRHLLEIHADYFSFKWWLFTSRLAVSTWASTLHQAQRTLPETIQIACVGQSTAEAVAVYLKRTADFIPSHASDAKHFADGFHHHVSDSRNDTILVPTTALWVCSELADDTFQRQLELQGHEIQRVSLYRPEPLESDLLEARLKEAEAFQPDIVLLSSPSNVRVLNTLGTFQRLQPRLWLCLGKKTHQAVQALGLNKACVDVLTHPTASDILNCVVEKLS